MKYLLILILFCLAAVATGARNAKGQTPSITFGAPGSREVHLKRDTVFEKAKTLRVVSKDYEFRQKPDSITFGRTITRIVVSDQSRNGNGGKALLTGGGPGHMYVQLHLKSQHGHGFNFIIDIFGQ